MKNLNKLQQLEQEIWIKFLECEKSIGNNVKINKNPAELEESIHQRFKYLGSSYHYKNGSLYKIIVNMLGNNVIIEEYEENYNYNILEEFNLKYTNLLHECKSPTGNTIIINDNPNKYYNGIKYDLDKLNAIYIFDEIEVIEIKINISNNIIIIKNDTSHTIL